MTGTHQFTPVGHLTILGSGLTMPGASGGLNKALAVNGMEREPGDEFVLAVSVRVKQLNFPPVKDTEGFQRVHVLEVLNAAEIDPETVEEALQAQARRVEEAQGIQRLPMDGDDPDPEEAQSP